MRIFSVTAVFSVLFVAVAAVYFSLTPPAGHDLPEKMKNNFNMKLLKLEEGDEIRQIEIVSNEKNEKIVLAREDKGWQIQYPVPYPADTLLSQGLETALRLSNKDRRLMPEKDWDEYGLKMPSMRIGIKTLRGKDARYLDFGAPSAIGDFIFARWEDEPEYFLLNADLKRAFTQTLYALRNKQVFRNDLAEAVKIHLKTSDGEFEIVRKDGNWLWSAPLAAAGRRVAPERAEEVLAQLGGIYIKDFLDNEKRPAPALGISDKSPVIQVWAQGETPETLRFGNELAERDSYYGLRDGENVFFLMARGNVRGLFEAVETLAHMKEEPLRKP